MNLKVDQSERGWQTQEWILGFLIIVLLVSRSHLGHRLPMVVQDVAFLVLIAIAVLLTAMAWNRFARARPNASAPSRQICISFWGCVALSLALVILLLVMCFSMSYMLSPSYWLWLSISCWASSLVALLTGMFGARSVRFPLFFGGLVMGGLVIVVPVIL